MSHSTRVRGLKPAYRNTLFDHVLSHSTRVRGLKLLPCLRFQKDR